MENTHPSSLSWTDGLACRNTHSPCRILTHSYCHYPPSHTLLIFWIFYQHLCIYCWGAISSYSFQYSHSKKFPGWYIGNAAISSLASCEVWWSILYQLCEYVCIFWYHFLNSTQKRKLSWDIWDFFMKEISNRYLQTISLSSLLKICS